MPKIVEMKNDKGDLMKTKKGEQMYEVTFVEGDKFIPMWQEPISEKRGKAVYPRLTMKCKFEDDSEHVVDLTPAQYNSLVKKKQENKAIYNQIFVAYEAHSEKYKKDFIAIGYESRKEPLKSFDEIRNPAVEESKEE